MNKFPDGQVEFFKKITVTPRKTCHHCGEDKPHAEFHKSSRSPDGLRASCKPCTHRMNAEAEVRRRDLRPMEVAPLPGVARKAPAGWRWLLLALPVVAATMFLSGYLMKKAECRDWSTVYAPGNQS